MEQELTIEDVKELMKVEFDKAQAEWDMCRKELSAATKKRAAIRRRLDVFNAQLDRAKAAALGKANDANTGS